MLAIKFVLNFIKILNKNASPAQIAGGMALGALIGFTPGSALLIKLAVLAAILMLNVNISSAILACGVFALFSYLLDPLFNRLGYWLLVHPGLKSLWTALYNTAAVPWTHFNNTLVLGSFVFGLLFFWPFFILITWFVKQYRERILTAVGKWKIVQMLKASKLYGLYESYKSYQ